MSKSKGSLLTANMMRVSKEPLVFSTVNQQRSAQISRRKSDINVNLYTSAAQRVQAKSLYFSTIESMNSCANQQNLLQISKTRLSKPQHLSLIQVGRDFSILKTE